MPAKLLKTFLLILIAFAAAPLLHAQEDTTWRVLLHQKNKLIIQHHDMTRFRKTGFLLARNVVYRITLTDDRLYDIKVLAVKPDSLLLLRLKSIYRYMPPDTLWVQFNELKTLHINDDNFGLGNHKLDKFNFVFERDTAPWFPSKWVVRRFYNDSVLTEISPMLTARGIFTTYTIDTNYRRPYVITYDTSTVGHDSIYRKRNWFGLTPSKREEINGLSFGVYNANIKNRKYHTLRDSLVTRGLVLELNPVILLAPIALMYFPTMRNGESYEDYLAKTKPAWKTRSYGLIFSFFNTPDTELYGVNIAGAGIVSELHGVSIAGLFSFSYVMKGVSISFANRSYRSRGVQLGVFNKSYDHRGLQIGLWNVNAKRKLPLINWQTKG